MTPNMDNLNESMENGDNAEQSTEDSAASREILLVSRVEDYLLKHKDEDVVDIDKITVTLRRKYKDYRNKNLRPTNAMIHRAYLKIAEKYKQQNDSADEQSVINIEETDIDDKTDTELPAKKDKKKQNNDSSKLFDISTASDNFLNDIPLFEPIEMPGTNSLSTYTKINETQVQDVTLNEAESDSQVKSHKSHKSKKRDKEKGIASTLEQVTKKKPKEFLVKNSTNNFSDIGGNDELLQRVCWKIKHLKFPHIVENYKKKSPSRGFLLHGPSGCGKTLLSHAIAGYLNVPLLEIAATDIVAGVTGESEGNLRDLFDQAEAIAPCVLFLDKIDALATNRENAQKGMEKRVVDQLSLCLDKLGKSENKNKVLVLGATNQLESLDQSLRTPGRFEEEFCLGIPNKDARTSILKILTKEVNLAPDVSLEKISQMTPGYVASELDKLINEAEDEALRRVWGVNSQELISSETSFNLTNEQLMQICIEERDFDTALKIVKPSVKKEGGFVSVPNVTWDDVGSLQNIRDELSLDILGAVKYPDMYDGDTEIETGVLLCGPPGCGKTLLAKAMANEAGINFISVKGPEFLNKYVGESEKNVRKCFIQARNAAPCLIFFDELDALCPKRSEIDGNATSRVVNAMLTELDGVSDRKNVFVMAATNRPEIIDPALLRSGRFDKIIYVGLPKPEDRFEILNALTRNGTRPKLSENVNLKEIAFNERCEGFSGADLKGLVKQAKREYVRDKISNNLTSEHVSKEHFDKAFQIIKPTVRRKDMKRYKKLEKLYSVGGSKYSALSQKTLKTESRRKTIEIVEEPIDPLLISRIKTYLLKNKKQNVNVTITGTANHIHNQYKDYENEEIGSLRVKVRRVFNQLLGSSMKLIATPRDIKQEKNNPNQNELYQINNPNNTSKRPRDIDVEETPLSFQTKKKRQNDVDASKNQNLVEILNENLRRVDNFLEIDHETESSNSHKKKKKKKSYSSNGKVHALAGCCT